ncbi:MAG TPA: SRPBCC family protein [Candidatus Angelobacter sp.]|nr:SRPBCC family protein [Candidatus Angelobacter sp.]
MSGLKNKRWMLFGSLAAGAAALYFLDPDHGERRRKAIATRLKHAGSDMAEEASKSARDVWHRFTGKARQLWTEAGEDQPDDTVLAERIRSRMGRIVSRPHDVHVLADHGAVTFWGTIAPAEMRALLHAAKSTRGVREIWNHLEFDEQTRATHAIDSLAHAKKTTLLNWSPSKRALVGTAGAAAALYGLRRRDAFGYCLTALGAGLAVSSTMKKNVRSLLALSPDCPGFELQETIRVNAPISEIYDFWLNPANYPKVFAHIDGVEPVGENRFRWSVTGPAGIPIRWEGTITRAVPNTLVEWKSLPGATVGNFGTVRFDPIYDASTRVNVRMFYHPPAGILGRFLAEMFGTDPRKVLRDDLRRMKMLFEADENLLKQLNTNETDQLLKTAGC